MKQIALLLNITLLFGFTPPMRGDSLSQKDLLTLAQAVVGEADWSRKDHVAIAWVLAKRWHFYKRSINYKAGATFSGFVRQYSSPLKIKNRRSKLIQSLPWGPALQPHSHGIPLTVYNKKWAKTRQTIQHWYDGKIKDPCRRAVHWGGPMDNPDRMVGPGTMWHIVRCGETKNIFYGISKKKNST